MRLVQQDDVVERQFRERMLQLADAFDRAGVPRTYDYAYMMVSLSAQTLMIIGLDAKVWAKLTESAWQDCDENAIAVEPWRVTPVRPAQSVRDCVLQIGRAIEAAGLELDGNMALVLCPFGTEILYAAGMTKGQYLTTTRAMYVEAVERLKAAGQRGGQG